MLQPTPLVGSLVTPSDAHYFDYIGYIWCTNHLMLFHYIANMLGYSMMQKDYNFPCYKFPKICEIQILLLSSPVSPYIIVMIMPHAIQKLYPK